MFLALGELTFLAVPTGQNKLLTLFSDPSTAAKERQLPYMFAVGLMCSCDCFQDPLTHEVTLLVSLNNVTEQKEVEFGLMEMKGDLERYVKIGKRTETQKLCMFLLPLCSANLTALAAN